jgi:beta-1,4-mannosyl-glycoprotein beta-1,4-N-acetylglucosaminyltransferase
MLVDAFMFYNELDILELRLEVLDKYVDRFILVEAEVNHVGGSKELFFEQNKDRYAKWLPKIKHIVITADEAPKEPNPWAREKYQRECIVRGLDDIPPDAIVMVSDVDEIPKMDQIPYTNLPQPICAIHMWMFEYSFDYLFTGEPWFGTVMTNCELLKRVGPNHLRDNRWKFPCFKFSGWHLSSFGDAQHVWNKMQTFAHAKDGHHAAQTPELFQRLISQGLHTDERTSLLRRPDDIPLPASFEIIDRLKLRSQV